MGLQEIVGKIESDAEVKARQIVDGAKAEAEKTLVDAQTKAKQRVQEAREKAANEAKMIIARESSRANVEASQMYHEKLNEEVNESMDTIRDSLKDFTKSQDYQKLLQKLIAMATKALGDDCKIYARSDDLPKLKTGKANVMQAQEDFSGGIKATSSDGLMSVDYTLEALLDKTKDKVAVELLEYVK